MIAPGAVDWAVFGIAVATVLLVDLAVAGRGRAQTLRSAGAWSGIWIGLGLAFGAFVALRFGGDAGLTYLTAYALEKSLSVDNMFVFLLIFSQTGVPARLQRRALFWGIVGALVMRALLIGAGVYLLARFHWVIYPFAALLLFAAARMLWGEESQRRVIEASCAVCSSWVARIIPITPLADGQKFLSRRDGALKATPLLVALILIEATDVVFAVDSIPAVLAVTREPFLVYTSNVFALLGLRSLYLVLAGVMRRLRFLRTGLAVMLLFVAAKMLLAGAVEIPAGVSLAVIAAIFTASIVASRLFPGPQAPARPAATGCTHRGEIRDVSPRTRGCEQCLKTGDAWVQLRMCLACGHVGCCDSSKNRHATRHFEASRHPIMRSMEPGESWKWCYVDRAMVD